MATFFDYASATTVFFNNLDRNWPAEMTVLLVMILLLMFLVNGQSLYGNQTFKTITNI
ncbi:hypothetical protein ABID99_000124 [Mucilaginibacter sp. OAE612]